MALLGRDYLIPVAGATLGAAQARKPTCFGRTALQCRRIVSFAGPMPPRLTTNRHAPAFSQGPA